MIRTDKGSLSRRMFLKIAGWLTLAGTIVKIPGICPMQQEKSEIISENRSGLRAKGERWAGIFPGLPEKDPTRGSS